MVRSSFITVAILLILGSIIVPINAQDRFIQNWEANWLPDGSRIAFSSNRSGDYDIWIMDANGSNQVNLTSDIPGNQSNPIWSPNQQFIAFLSYEEYRQDKLWVIKADRSGLHQLTSDDQVQVSSFTWSPDSRHIVYQLEDTSAVWIVERNGTNQQTIHLEEHYPDYPYMKWITNGANIADLDGLDSQVIPINDQYTLALIFLHKYTEPMLPCTSNDWCLEYTFDRDAISVSSKKLAIEYTFEVEPHLQSAVLSPNWRVVFVTRYLEMQKLWVLNAITGDIQLLLSEAGTNGDFDPQWSPDGQQILFTWQENNCMGRDLCTGRDLWLINSDGTNLRNLTCDNTAYACVQ